MLHKISIIAFDLDDTLWPCQPTIEYAEEALYVWLSEQYQRITELYSRKQILQKRKQFTVDNPAYSVDMSLMRRQFLRLLAEEADYDVDAVECDGFEIFFHARQQVTFYDDVLPGMQRLKKHYRLGAISNGNASVEHVGLGHMIEHAVSASDVNVAKPDKRIFHRLAQCFDTELSRILYVGDHPHYDVVGPESAGMPAIWMNRENAEWPDDLPKPRHEVSDLVQLEELLRGG